MELPDSKYKITVITIFKQKKIKYDQGKESYQNVCDIYFRELNRSFRNKNNTNLKVNGTNKQLIRQVKRREYCWAGYYIWRN